MALDGTIDNPRQLLVASKEPLGFYYTGTDGTTGLPLSDEQIQSLLPLVAIIPKSRPQADPADQDWMLATWHRGKKGLRGDIEWGNDFVAAKGVTYVGFGQVQGTDEPQQIFGYFKAI